MNYTIYRAGLMGWNCNHSFALFQEGSKRNYTDEQLQDMKEHTVTYNGESMPDYEASQLQRGMERDIRKTKRELTALDELQKQKPTNETKTEFAALSVKLKNQEAKLKNFCRQTERRVDTTRTGVFATQSGMGFGRSTSAKAVWANKKALTKKENERIIKEIKDCGIVGEVHYPAKKIDVSKFPLDIEHTQKKHDVTEEEAREFVKNAKFSVTRWDGQFENYYAEDGGAFVNVNDSNIKTAFKKEEFTDAVNKAMEVLKNNEK